ncbi:MAG: hypothetical protein IPI37_06295 [Bacteroidales bacterium]|nr:hypothetical protein [Bacteroidales bacterium]
MYRMKTIRLYFLMKSMVTGSMNTRIRIFLVMLTPSSSEIKGFIQIIRSTQLKYVDDDNIEDMQSQGEQKYLQQYLKPCNGLYVVPYRHHNDSKEKLQVESSRCKTCQARKGRENNSPGNGSVNLDKLSFGCRVNMNHAAKRPIISALRLPIFSISELKYSVVFEQWH